MKKYVLDFLRRGVFALGFGPIFFAILYMVLKYCASVRTLTVDQLTIGIFSLSALAFIAGGMNVIYQIDRLPLMGAISIHGAVLYISYLITYLVNGWLEWGIVPILVFTGIFVIGYLLIWAIIYRVIRRNTEKINKILKEKQEGF